MPFVSKLARLLFISLALLAPLQGGQVHAQPVRQPVLEPETSPPPVTAEQPRRYRRGTALALALAGTSVGVGLLSSGLVLENGYMAAAGLAGVVVLPSLGNLYADDTAGALKAIGLRTGAAVMTIGAMAYAFRDCGSDGCGVDDDELAVAVGSAIMLGAGVVYSLFDAPRSATRGNRRASRLNISPSSSTSADGNRSYGLALTGIF